MRVKNFWNVLLNVLFPPICVSCEKHVGGETLCQDCFKGIEINSAFHCPKCLRRLPDPKNICHPEVKFVLASASSYFNKAVQNLIQTLKYRGIKSTLTPIKEVFRLYFNKILIKSGFKDFIIVPIPLHPNKERERGFNQALLISNILGEILNVGVIELLQKVKNTPSQTGTKSYEERSKNVENCFVLQKDVDVRSKNILLVDDVFTSGATMKEAVKILKNGGAKKIIGVVVARA